MTRPETQLSRENGKAGAALHAPEQRVNLVNSYLTRVRAALRTDDRRGRTPPCVEDIPHVPATGPTGYV